MALDQSGHSGEVGHELAGGAFHALFDAVDEALLLVDIHGRVSLANARFWSMFGLRPGADVDEIRSGIADCMGDRAAYLAAVDEAAEAAGGEQEFLLVRPKRRVVRRRVGAVRDADGRLIGRLVSYRDVTRDAELNRMKTEFVTNVSHELRTPMAAIKGFLQVVLDDEDTIDPVQRRNFLQIARQQTDRLSRLIDDLLQISRIESGRQRLQPNAFPVADLLRDVSLAIRPELKAAELELQVEAPPAELILNADRDKTAQVLLNLLSNAVKFTPAGGQVSVDWAVADGELSITVRDTGRGIATDDLPHIFEKFYRCRAVGMQPEGTGLGLAIAQELMHAHDGRIEVTSTLGAGSAFTVTLPLERTEAT